MGYFLISKRLLENLVAQLHFKSCTLEDLILFLSPISFPKLTFPFINNCSGLFKYKWPTLRKTFAHFMRETNMVYNFS
jgi:hypothetical protein